MPLSIHPSLKQEQFNLFPAPLLVSDILKDWYVSLAARSDLKATTLSAYRYKMENVLIPYLGAYEAERFDGQILEDFFAEYRGSEDKVSPGTLRLLRSILQQAFDYAAEQGRIRIKVLQQSKEMTGRAQVIKMPTSFAELEVLSAEELIRLKTGLQKEDLLSRLELLLPLYSGCTLSELCALRWGDVKLETGIGQPGVLHIRYELVRVQKPGKEEKKKTELLLSEKLPEQQRFVYLPELLVQELREEEQNEGKQNEGKQNEEKQNDNRKFSYVLTGTQKPMDPRTYQNHIRAALQRFQIEKGSPTVLRDTYAVLCLRQGASEYSLALQLGVETARLVERYRAFLRADYGFLENF